MTDKLKKKILITGASGMLGKDIAKSLTACNDFQTFGIVRNASQHCPTHEIRICNLTDIEHLNCLTTEINPDIIIHSAAVVNLDECEINHQLADGVHVQATDILSHFNNTSVRFIYISTDSVFNGMGGPYREEDSTDPVNYYSESKRQGEIVSLKNNPNSVVLRTNIYGYHQPKGKSLGEWAIESLRTGKSINGFSDVFFNPLYTKQVATLIKNYFLQNIVNGIWHLGSQGSFSKYEFLKRLSDRFGFDSSLVVSSSIEDIQFTTRRPKATTLDVKKMQTLIQTPITLENGLNEYFIDYINN